MKQVHEEHLTQEQVELTMFEKEGDQIIILSTRRCDWHEMNRKKSLPDIRKEWIADIWEVQYAFPRAYEDKVPEWFIGRRFVALPTSKIQVI
jgi:hypothetical protein